METRSAAPPPCSDLLDTTELNGMSKLAQLLVVWQCLKGPNPGTYHIHSIMGMVDCIDSTDNNLIFTATYHVQTVKCDHLKILCLVMVVFFSSTMKKSDSLWRH